MNNEPTNTTTNRIKPPKQVSQSVYINLEDLESLREIEQAKRRERVFEYNSRGW